MLFCIYGKHSNTGIITPVPAFFIVTDISKVQINSSAKQITRLPLTLHIFLDFVHTSTKIHLLYLTFQAEKSYNILSKSNKMVNIEILMCNSVCILAALIEVLFFYILFRWLVYSDFYTLAKRVLIQIQSYQEMLLQCMEEACE